tara:strand:+ start:385 stop:771 length:387 start_codon:yes stop_codon:yes gene_type:complete
MAEYMNTIDLVQGDDLPSIEITLRDSNKALNSNTVLDQGNPDTWAVLDLSAVTHVKLKYRRMGSTNLIDTIPFVIENPPTAGKITLVWNLTSLDDGTGEYEGEIEILYSDGKFMTITDKMRFDVRGGF